MMLKEFIKMTTFLRRTGLSSRAPIPGVVQTLNNNLMGLSHGIPALQCNLVRWYSSNLLIHIGNLYFILYIISSKQINDLHTNSFQDAQPPFYFILFYFILFYFILFYFILSILFYFILLLFYFIFSFFFNLLYIHIWSFYVACFSKQMSLEGFLCLSCSYLFLP